jgi:hypothetical protein
MHENRETSEMPEATLCDRPAGEGESRTARVHVFEESDFAIVPMKSPNRARGPNGGQRRGGNGGKGGGQGESRVCAYVPDPEPDSTYPSATGDALAAGRGGTRQHPRQEPYAVIPLVRICAGGGQ